MGKPQRRLTRDLEAEAVRLVETDLPPENWTVQS